MSKKFLSMIVAAEMLFEVYEILQNGTQIKIEVQRRQTKKH